MNKDTFIEECWARGFQYGESVKRFAHIICSFSMDNYPTREEYNVKCKELDEQMEEYYRNV